MKVPLNLVQFQRFSSGEGVRGVVEDSNFGEDEQFLINAKTSNLELVLVSPEGTTKKFVRLSEPMYLDQVLDKAGIAYSRDTTDGHFVMINNNVKQLVGQPPYKISRLHIFINRVN